MKKLIFVVGILFLLTGCAITNKPSSKVEDILMKYQRVDNDISKEIDEVVSLGNFTDDHANRYRKLLINQYKNLSYEIKNELIDGDNATVTVAVTVVDYKNAISDLTFDSSIYSKESFDEEKLTRLENANGKVTYMIDLTLSKDRDGIWKLDALTNEQIKKIQGMY